MGMNHVRLATFVASAVLIATPAGQQIKGKVTAGVQRPVANARISVAENKTIATFTGPDGSYTLDGLNPGKYTVVASSPRYWPTSQADVDAGKTANFQLVERRYFANAGGMVLANLSPESATQFLVSAKIAGDTQAEYLIVNRLLEAKSTDQELQQLSASLTHTLNSQPAQINGKIFDRSGKTLAYADVKLTNDITGAVFWTKTDHQGKYELSVFPVGNYTIDAAKGDQAASFKIVDPIVPNTKFTHDVKINTGSINVK